MVNLKLMKRFGLTGIILMAFVAVSCIDSPDEKSSQKKETEISETTASLALAVPADWKCKPSFYGTGDGCDCGCGVIDPDCKDKDSTKWGSTIWDSTIWRCDYYYCWDEEEGVYPYLNHLCHEHKINIMPVGDSITAGEHYKKPAEGIRTGYRKDLNKYLTDKNLTGESYIVDFVGSRPHGNKFNPAYDWHNEAYPGEPISVITSKLKNTLNKLLPVDRPDILLVHVGTNNLRVGVEQLPKDAAKEVEDMLNMIKGIEGKKPTYVFLCKIISWFNEDPKKTGIHPETTEFNRLVADAVALRKEKDDGFKIVMVDMEKGAGFNYTHELQAPKKDDNPNIDGDMWGKSYPGVSYDRYHPNDLGNTKMAKKFLDVLMSQALKWER